MLGSLVSKHPAGHPQRVKSRDQESLHGLEQMGSATPPLAIHRLHDDRRRQLRLYRIREAFGLDSQFSPLPPLFLVLITGLYRFVLPYVAKRRACQTGA